MYIFKDISIYVYICIYIYIHIFYAYITYIFINTKENQTHTLPTYAFGLASSATTLASWRFQSVSFG